MKIRQGFVSNSSSSSFVVALPKEPQNIEEVKEMLFGKVDGALSVYDSDPISFYDIAHRVWKDIRKAKDNKGKKNDSWRQPHKIGTLSGIADTFASKYYYSVQSYCNDEDVDGKGGSWYTPIGEFFGSDKKLMDDLRDTFIKKHKMHEKNSKEKNVFEKSNGPFVVSWAVKDGKDNKGNPFSKEAIAGYKKYCDDYDTFRKSKEYVSMENRHRKEEMPIRKEIQRLTDLISKADAKAFMEKNKGKFIFITSYADDNGDGDGTFEHGDIFHNVPHVTINNH